MRMTLAALLAVALGAGATPAAACDYFHCIQAALNDDYYPAGDLRLPENVRELVAARQGRGLSLSGFYNDPAIALSRPAPARYEYAPAPVYAPAPEPAYVRAPEPGYAPAPGFGPAPLEGGYEPRRRHGPHVILSPFGNRRDDGRYAHERRHRPQVY